MSMLVAVACSLLVPVVLGTFWFSPVFLGTPWLRYVFGPGKGPKRDSMVAVFVASNIGYIVAFSLQYMLLREFLGVSSIEDCVKYTGAFIGMILGTQISHYAFGERPIGQYVIEQLFNVVVLLCTAVIIATLG